MEEPIYYVDIARIREGKVSAVRAGMRELAEFAQANNPRVIAYNFFIDEEDSTMTVIAIHPDSAALELHMERGGPKFRAFSELIELRSIDVYGGELSSKAMSQLSRKAEFLGGASLTLHSRQAGFERITPPEP